MLVYILSWLTIFGFMKINCGKITFLPMGQEQNQFYGIKTQVGNLQMTLKLSLNNGQSSWIKQSNCKLCQLEKCEKSCFSDEHFGIKCVNPYCELQKGQTNKNTNIRGPNALITLQFGEIQQFSCPMILAQKMYKRQNVDGVINPIIPSSKIFNKVQLLKDHQPGIQLLHSEKYLGSVVGDPIKLQGLQKYVLNLFQVSQFRITTYLQDQKIPIDFQIPINHMNARIDIDSKLLSVPKKTYTKVIAYIMKSFFNQTCKHNDDQIACETTITLDKISKSQFQITLNGVEIKFPLLILFYGCKQKSCKILISENSNNQVVIGDFILNLFAVQFDLKESIVNFLRLDNQWAKFYKIDKKYTQQQLGLVWGMIMVSYTALTYLLQFILFCALLSIFINCIYKRYQLYYWCVRIVRKMTKNKQNSLKQGVSDKDIAHLINQQQFSGVQDYQE